ncbi:glycoside hydrolase [Corynespora cassiicola Philippines]|uniref:chitinase n=1 Tax=Corynespora cassiicola Philippines TaxID=1448308 RepID=A0A2T2NQF0_CORCC|nr:glycoside hydrolase [Corynespora cassiicola Philippines]
MRFHNAAALLSLPLFSSAIPLTGSFGSKGWQMGVYYVNWAIYGRQHFVTDLPAERLTKITYAFANVNNQTGEISLSDEWADVQFRYPTDVDSNGTTLYGNFNQLYQLKQQNRKLKVILSVGGWSYRANFKPALATEAGRVKFAESSLQLIKDLGLDGFDVDWEYPEDATDAANLVDTLRRMRTLYDEYSAKYANNYHFEITVAAPAGPLRYNVLDIAGMDQYVDEWNLMAFDYQGPGFSNFTGHNSNVYPSKKLPQATDFNTKQTIDHYKSQLKDPRNIILGLPAYGRSFANVVSGKDHGLGQRFNGSGDGTWEAGVLDYKALPLNGSTVYTDKKLIASWSYDNATRQFVTFDTPEVQVLKAKYLMKEGLGGAWWWDSSSDRTDDRSLITTVGEYIGGTSALARDQNWLNFPLSKYDNIRAQSTNATTFLWRH